MIQESDDGVLDLFAQVSSFKSQNCPQVESIQNKTSEWHHV